MIRYPKRNKFDLLIQLVKTSFKMRYQNSVLGFLWVLIKPYATFIVLFLIWSKIRTGTIPHYSMYLLTGIILYTYFNEMIMLGQMALLENAHIILKVNFPRQIVILSAMIGAIINLFVNSILIVIFAVITHLDLTFNGLLYFAFIAGIMFIFALGVSLFTSIFTIKFRDLKNMFELGLFLLYWGTPIFYVTSQDIGASNVSKIIRLNPLGTVIGQVRAGLNIYGDVNTTLMIEFLIGAVIILILGWLYFQRKVKHVAEYF